MRIVEHVPGRISAASLDVHQLQVAEQAVKDEGKSEDQLVGSVERDGFSVYAVERVPDRGASDAHGDQHVEQRSAVAVERSALARDAVRLSGPGRREKLGAPLAESQKERERQPAKQQPFRRGNPEPYCAREYPQ